MRKFLGLSSESFFVGKTVAMIPDALKNQKGTDGYSPPVPFFCDNLN